MTNKLDQEKFTKFVSEKLKSAKSFKVAGHYFGEVEVYVHKVSFNFYNYPQGRVGVEVRFELKFKQITETNCKYGLSSSSAGRRRNDQIRHQINWIKDSDISIMCKMFGIGHINVDKITESKSKKKKI